MVRITKSLQQDKMSERHLLCFLRKLSDIVSGNTDYLNPKRPTLPKCLAIIQSENDIVSVKEAELWIKEIEEQLSLLKKGLLKAKSEIEILKNGKHSNRNSA